MSEPLELDDIERALKDVPELHLRREVAPALIAEVRRLRKAELEAYRAGYGDAIVDAAREMDRHAGRLVAHIPREVYRDAAVHLRAMPRRERPR